MRSITLIGATLGTLIVLAVVVVWWTGRPPRRPSGLSPNALHFEPSNVPFTLHQTGYWLDCWLDEHADVDRCKLTDVKGNALFEDVFLPCEGQSPVPKSDLVFDASTEAPMQDAFATKVREFEDEGFRRAYPTSPQAE